MQIGEVVEVVKFVAQGADTILRYRGLPGIRDLLVILATCYKLYKDWKADHKAHHKAHQKNRKHRRKGGGLSLAHLSANVLLT